MKDEMASSWLLVAGCSLFFVKRLTTRWSVFFFEFMSLTHKLTEYIQSAKRPTSNQQLTYSTVWLIGYIIRY